MHVVIVQIMGLYEAIQVLFPYNVTMLFIWCN